MNESNPTHVDYDYEPGSTFPLVKVAMLYKLLSQCLAQHTQGIPLALLIQLKIIWLEILKEFYLIKCVLIRNLREV